MFKIGEFSKLTQVSIRMLRYYDEVGLLKPAEIDKWTGYRMYSVQQIPRLNRILNLRDSGFNVSEIALAFAMSDKELAKCLEKKRLEVEQLIKNEKEKLRKIDIAKDELQGYKSEMHYNISIKSIPEYQVVSLRKVVPTYYSEGDLWGELCDFAKQQEIEITDETFTIYHDTEYKEQDVDMELCACVKQMQESIEPFCFRVTEPVQTMASTMVYGDFSNIAGAYKAFAQWLQKNSEYHMSGPTRQIVHRGPWNEDDPQKYLIELQIPLENKINYHEGSV